MQAPEFGAFRIRLKTYPLRDAQLSPRQDYDINLLSQHKWAEPIVRLDRCFQENTA
jgi:hypothetical protein